MADYSIWMLEYAGIVAAPTSAVVYGMHNSGTRRLPYSYTLLKGHGRTILLDCGLNNASHGAAFVEQFDVANWASPRDVLAEVGVTPEEIQHVVLTHAHFDHMGGLELFPNATFYIQQYELESWVRAMTLDRRFRWLMVATDTGDMIQAVQLAREGRMVSLAGDVDNLFPGVDLRVARDTHTPGSQYVVIRNDGRAESDDVYVYAGDLIYQHDNLHGGTPEDPKYVPVGLAMGSNTNLLYATHEIMQRVGSEIPRVLVGHEARMSDLYPSRVTARGHQLIEVALADGQRSYVS